jgi:hypothetical protein
MRRLLLVLVLLAALLFPAGEAAAKGCITPRKVEFAHGRSPTGEEWTAEASVKKNGSCQEWLFGIDFKFSGGFGWGSGTGIPVGGHTSRYEKIAGYAGPILEDASEGAVFGYTGAEVATVKLKMSDGSSLELHPRLPPEELRRKVVWMRGFRYFVDFYPGHGYVTEFWLFNRAGTLLDRNLHAEGELF